MFKTCPSETKKKQQKSKKNPNQKNSTKGRKIKKESRRTHEKKKKKKFFRPPKTKDRLANLETVPESFRKTTQRRQTETKTYFRIGASFWPAKRPNFVSEVWASIEKQKPGKTSPPNYHVQETMQSQPPNTKGDFVLGPAPGRPNVQTLSLEPGPG